MCRKLCFEIWDFLRYPNDKNNSTKSNDDNFLQPTLLPGRFKYALKNMVGRLFSFSGHMLNFQEGTNQELIINLSSSWKLFLFKFKVAQIWRPTLLPQPTCLTDFNTCYATRFGNRQNDGFSNLDSGRIACWGRNKKMSSKDLFKTQKKILSNKMFGKASTIEEAVAVKWVNQRSNQIWILKANNKHLHFASPRRNARMKTSESAPTFFCWKHRIPEMSASAGDTWYSVGDTNWDPMK